MNEIKSAATEIRQAMNEIESAITEIRQAMITMD